MAAPRWRIWIDTGGTFTDCLAIAPDGEVRRAKVLSSAALRGRLAAILGERRIAIEAAWRAFPGLLDGCELRWLAAGGEAATVLAGEGDELRLSAAPPAGIGPGAPFEVRTREEAPVLAARLVTGTPRGERLPPADLRLATTRGTNALLERRGARVALFLTAGFGDLLEIGTQQRPDLFALEVRKRLPLHEAVAEVRERLAADGTVLEDLDEAGLEAAARELLGRGLESAAVALLHSYRAPAHERRAGEVLRRAGWGRIALGSDLAPFLRLQPRAETVVVEAYLAPLLEDYLGEVEAALADEGRLRVMTSAGGLVRRAAFRAKDGLLSGPAGGVVGAVEMARRSGIERLVAFDMGGTSTDVSRFDGAYDYDFETRVGDAHLQAPTLAIESVAAGGGSICSTDGLQLRVGPESAGADPGPACYGAGGPLTLTDVNLLLGRVAADRFAIPLVPAAAERAAAAIEARLGAASGEDRRATLLAGFLAIANERMAEAIRRISVRRGFDPRGAALLAFGGAGGQHACAVAELLGMTTVLVPPDAGLLSAFGLGAAAIERFAERQVLRRLDELGDDLGRLLAELENEARAQIEREGEPATEALVRRLIFLRLVGQDASLQLDLGRGDGGEVAADFARAHRETYGYPPPLRPLEVEAVRVVVSLAPSRAPSPPTPPSRRPAAASATAGRVWFGERWLETPLFDREALGPGAHGRGPALVVDAHSTAVVEPGWSFAIDGAGALRIEHGL